MSAIGERAGDANGSQGVETIGVFDFRMTSICGITFLMEDDVHNMTTSAFADLSARAASPETLTSRRLVRPATSPRSRPIGT